MFFHVTGTIDRVGEAKLEEGGGDYSAFWTSYCINEAIKVYRTALEDGWPDAERGRTDVW